MSKEFNYKAHPLSVPYEVYAKNYDNIFRKKKCKKSHIPNKETMEAIEQTERDEGLTEYDSVEEMLKDLEG